MLLVDLNTSNINILSIRYSVATILAISIVILTLQQNAKAVSTHGR